eukprot:4126-Heterococcus_DN1.PRE.1
MHAQSTAYQRCRQALELLCALGSWHNCCSHILLRGTAACTSSSIQVHCNGLLSLLAGQVGQHINEAGGQLVPCRSAQYALALCSPAQ